MTFDLTMLRLVAVLPTQPLRILARPAFSSGGKNPYTSLLYREVQAAGHDVVEYSLGRALTGRWDIVHVHWPESVFNHTLIEALPTTEALLLGLRRARRRGAKIVWTIHNLQAHERRHVAWEQAFRARYFGELDGIISLSQAGLVAAQQAYPILSGLPAWIVPHPHYRGQYPDTVSRAEARAALNLPQDNKILLSVGRVFEYKNFQALVAAVRKSPHADWTALVAGEPRDATVEESLRQVAQADPRIRLDLQFVPSDKLQLYLRAADLVVQPYREILNSGTALLALSFDRPVLLPHRGAGVELAQVPGKPWVQTYTGELGAEHLAAALDAVAALPERTQGEHLAAYSHANVGQSLLAAFTELAGR
jgi:beta-1,4-mannosyltransferase